MSWILRVGSKSEGFSYRAESGKRVSHRTIERIAVLRIPPAWKEVHVSPNDRSAIQAWGYDTRGRKQYRYHPHAIREGELRKYYRVRQMGRDLPTLRQRLAYDMRSPGLPREKVLATIIQLVAMGFFRVGNERYLRDNKTFGITTLNKSHVEVDDDCLIFTYVGKRSIRHRQTVVAPALAHILASILKTPGRRLFRYQQDAGWHNVTARDVNTYFHQISGGFPYTVKDLRTWGGTLRAATVLAELGAPRNITEAKKNIVTTVRLVAAELGNTPTICRKSYVHPVIIEQYLNNGETIHWRQRKSRSPFAHTPEEHALITFLDTHFPERRKRPRRLRTKATPAVHGSAARE